jgi:hypothetical protein
VRHLFDDVLETQSRTGGYEPEVRLALRLEGVLNAAQGRRLIRNPVQRIEGNHPVELPVGREVPGVGHREREIGVVRTQILVLGIRHHVREASTPRTDPRGTRVATAAVIRP